MALLYPSEEWLIELKDSLNANPDYEKAAANWEGALILHIQADENLDKDYFLWADPYHGKVRDAKLLNSLDDEKAEFVLSGKYSTWKTVVKGDLDAMKAIMKSKIKVKGNMAFLLKQTKASNVLMKVQQSIDTLFIDEQ